MQETTSPRLPRRPRRNEALVGAETWDVVPVVITVSSSRFAEWIKFAGGMSVKLGCDRHALHAWLTIPLQFRGLHHVLRRRGRPRSRRSEAFDPISSLDAGA
jgi:hypothetical protein